ncbi:hypothetical protein GN958_ATG12181 [Phytophthora infestans]|uniref:Uncharacterized protein n=1 Tax=Phytophthora infestans TaxID=4787 RepID=A0A8S9UDN9_PHYIN|nr:hypothetical protein GN958_ATG12181 [Phytophthora infestans]
MELRMQPLYDVSDKKLAEVTLCITERDVRQFYFHIEHFIPYALDKSPVFTRHIYENSHRGDEMGQCPLLQDTVAYLLAICLPQTFESLLLE